MNANRSIIVSDARRMMFVIGLLTAALAGFLSLTKQASMQSDAPPVFDSTAQQPDALGRLAFQRLNFFTSGSATTSLLSVNADGANLTTLAAAGIPPLFNGEPAWSPDGAKIAYVQDSEIYVMNADGSNKINITNNSVTGERNPSWSAANKIAYERSSQIWTMNADGSNQTQFSAITQASPLAPAWSPDGSKLAFTSGGEIWVINADGTNERRVTNNSITDADPAWSPDGAKIIFGKSGSGIAVVNLDGTGESNLTNGATDGKPNWSNDGTKIAFVRRAGANGGIFTMDANGANQARIVADQTSQPGRNENDNPAWQPVPVAPNTFIIGGRITRDGGIGLNNVTVNLTGTTTATATTNALGFYQFGNLPGGGNYTLTPFLVGYTFTPPSQTFTNLNSAQTANFTATGGNGFCQGNFCYSNGRIAYNFNFGAANFKIATINPDATGRTIITGEFIANDSEPSYSPDGAKIVFVRSTPAGIYRINADGSGITQLTTGNDTYPSYSPDGASIVFVRNQTIFKMNADGSNQTQLSNQAGDNHPAFSPNGVKIAFTRANTIHTMNADGTNQTQLITASSSMPSYSPDGRNIVYLTSTGISVMNADGTNQILIRASGTSPAKPSYSPDGTKILFMEFELSFGRIKTMNSDGSGVISVDYGYTADWQPIRQLRRTEFDFDGDLKADISVFRPSNGFWYRLNSQNNSFYAVQFGQAGDKPAPADYDGDGKTDIAVFREGGLGYFYILNSADNTFRFAQFGTTGDAPVPGDWDGDSKADLAVYRGGNTIGSQSNFYYRPSSQPSVDYQTITNGTGGRPVVGDFDGDGRIDPALFLPSGVWSILRSSDNQATQTTFGAQSDIPVVADFDGDGRTNIAVFRPSNGTWYTSQNAANNYGAIVFGADGDLPVPADYDGDGRADAAVFRPSNGVWYLNRSTAGFTGAAFGQAGDKPIPNAFVP